MKSSRPNDQKCWNLNWSECAREWSYHNLYITAKGHRLCCSRSWRSQKVDCFFLFFSVLISLFDGRNQPRVSKMLWTISVPFCGLSRRVSGQSGSERRGLWALAWGQILEAVFGRWPSILPIKLLFCIEKRWQIYDCFFRPSANHEDLIINGIDRCAVCRYFLSKRHILQI